MAIVTEVAQREDDKGKYTKKIGMISFEDILQTIIKKEEKD